MISEQKIILCMTNALFLNSRGDLEESTKTSEVVCSKHPEAMVVVNKSTSSCYDGNFSASAHTRSWRNWHSRLPLEKFAVTGIRGLSLYKHAITDRLDQV